MPEVPVASDLLQQGQRIAAQAGCLKCHSIDGSAHIGPTFLDLYLRRERLQNGETITADEAYLTESIMDPLAKIVGGYPPVMPTFQGRLSPPEIGALVEYIRSLHTVGPASVESKGPVYAAEPQLERGSLRLNTPAALGAIVTPSESDGGAILDGGTLPLDDAEPRGAESEPRRF